MRITFTGLFGNDDPSLFNVCFILAPDPILKSIPLAHPRARRLPPFRPGLTPLNEVKQGLALITQAEKTHRFLRERLLADDVALLEDYLKKCNSV